MVDIHSATAKIKRGKKKKTGRRNHRAKMSTSATQIGHKKYKHYESKLTATMHDL